MNITPDLINRDSFERRLVEAKLEPNEIHSVMLAYRLAKSAHRNKTRDDGTRYFEHCRAGCLILMDELGIYDSELLAGFLLHDTGEDTDLLGYILESYSKFLDSASYFLVNMFGLRVYETVVRLTKPAVDNITFFDLREVYDYYIKELKKSDDAVFLKSIDRLHNLRSLLTSNPEKTARQIQETEDVYLPIFRSLTGKHYEHIQIVISKIEKQITILKSR